MPSPVRRPVVVLTGLALLVVVAAAVVWWQRAPRVEPAEGATVVGTSATRAADVVDRVDVVRTLPERAVVRVARPGADDEHFLLDRGTGGVTSLPAMSEVVALREDGSGVGVVRRLDAEAGAYREPTALVGWDDGAARLVERDVADLFGDLEVAEVRSSASGPAWVQLELTLAEGPDAVVVAVLDRESLDVLWSAPLDDLRDRLDADPAGLPDLLDVLPGLPGGVALATAGPGTVALRPDDGEPLATSPTPVRQLGGLLVLDEDGAAVGWSVGDDARRWSLADVLTAQVGVDARAGVLTLPPRDGGAVRLATAATPGPDDGPPRRRPVSYDRGGPGGVALGDDPVTGDLWLGRDPRPVRPADDARLLGQWAFAEPGTSRLRAELTEVRSVGDGTPVLTARGDWTLADLGPTASGDVQVLAVRVDGSEVSTTLVEHPDDGVVAAPGAP